MNNRGGIKTAVIVGLILIILIIAVYFTFFFYYTCKDVACFKAHQEKCSKTKFLNSVEGAEWYYKINEEKNGKCEIEVNILKLNLGEVNKLSLEGKSMICLLNLKDINSPESDISKCHGELKEEMQNLIIQRLHSYIIDNLGVIGEELNKITGAGIIVSGNVINKSTNITG